MLFNIIYEFVHMMIMTGWTIYYFCGINLSFDFMMRKLNATGLHYIQSIET